MSQVSVARIALLFSGLAAILLSVALQDSYPTDVAPALSGPGSTAIIAIAGMVLVGIVVARNRRK